MSDTDKVTLPAECAKCGGWVTLFLAVWSSADPARTQMWKCPHCHEANSAELPGKVGAILARHRDSPNQKKR